MHKKCHLSQAETHATSLNSVLWAAGNADLTFWLTVDVWVCMQNAVQVAGKFVKGQQQATRSHPYEILLQLYLSRFLPRGSGAESHAGALPG